MLAMTCTATTLIAMRLTAERSRSIAFIARKQAVRCVSSQRQAASKAEGSGKPLSMYRKSLLHRNVTRLQSVEADRNGCGRSRATAPSWLRAVMLKMCGSFTSSLPRLRILVIFSSSINKMMWQKSKRHGGARFFFSSFANCSMVFFLTFFTQVL